MAQPDYQYLNFDLVHNAQYGTAQSPATLEVNRSVAMIDRMEEYKCTIQRLVFPSLSIPFYVASLLQGSDYADGTMVNTFALGICTDGERVFSDPINAIWVPSLRGNIGSGEVKKSLQPDNPYYYADDMQTVLDMFNTAIAKTVANLRAKAGGDIVPASQKVPILLCDTQAPYLLVPIEVYDAPTADAFSWGFIPTTERSYMELYINNQSVALFNGFPFTQVPPNTAGFTPLPPGIDVAFKVNSLINISENVYPYTLPATDPIYPDFAAAPPVTSSNVYGILYPQGYSMSFWSPASKFLVTTTIPVEFEVISGYNPNYGTITPNSIGTTGNQNPSSSILTDFAFENTDFQAYGTQYVYNKTDSTRFTAITGFGPLQRFALSLFWVAKDGQQVPLYLLPLTIASLKILFVKK